ncbi:sodium/proline symporter [Streptomyces sp. CC53]|uniref:sodium/proline symporter PutP n=1 Tax=unclassified Streptomyces TaxID=2593676 RepID=UPI0008DEA21A|nr:MULTISPECIES: sodium/proline symporter PutP [unclassified Streptomyces]OII60208.1 sodium/proline symporter [Streptomyces sp. CC53]
MFDLSAPILVTFVLYVGAMIGVGVWAYTRTRTFNDFALGGRRLSAPVAALSAGASDMSGWLFLALPGAVYAAGIGAGWIAVGLAVGTYLNWRFVAPRLRTYTERAGNAVSLSAYLEERFEDRTRLLRTVSAAVTVAFFTVYLASGLVAGGLLFEYVFDVDFALAVVLTALVIAIYSCLGGFLAVSHTHVLQGLLMLLALLVLPVVGVRAVGGFDALGDALDVRSPALLDPGSQAVLGDGGWSSGGPLGAVAIVSLLAWGLGYFGQPHILARFMGIRSTRAIPAARRIGTAWVLAVLAGATLVGLVGIAGFGAPLDNPETVYLALSRTLLDPWVAGVFLIAVLAAVISTADSQLLVSSVALTEDFYRAFLKREASDRALVWAGRGSVLAVTLIACAIALRGDGLLGIVAYAWAGFGAAFGPVVLLSLYWPRMTWAGAMAGIVSGAATVLFWEELNPLLGPLESGIYEMVPGVVVATVAALVFGRFVGRPPQRAFWRMPGGGASRLMLAPFLAHAPVGMAVLDTDLRYVWVNDLLERLLPLERRLGRQVREVLPEEESQAFEDRMRRVLETGSPVLDFEFLGPDYEDPRRKRAYSASFFGMQDRHGRYVGIWYMLIDVTERWRAQERLALLSEAGARIGRTLDVALTAQELADDTVPRFADYAAVDLLEPVLSGEEPPPGPVGGTPALGRAGRASVRGEGPAADPAAGEAVIRGPSSPVARCLLEGRTLVEDAAGGPVAGDPALSAVLDGFGGAAVMAVPVKARGVTLGAAVFVRSRRLGPYEEDDVRLAEELVSRAALSLDNARRFNRERHAARSMQRYLLPQEVAGGSALEVASWYYPADAPSGVGGDWFDVIPLSGTRVALVVGDVVGHGMNAAATMGRLRTAVRTLAHLDLPPDELLARLDDLVIGLVETHDGGEAAGAGEQEAGGTLLGATCLYAVYDPVGRHCTLARAGHMPPVVAAPDGSVDFVDLPAGPPLGLGSLPFESVELELAEGSVIALYTDGLIEACDRDVDVGLSRLVGGLARPGASLEETGGRVIDALLTGPPSDDVALLLARTHVLGSEQVASWELPVDPAAVARARNLASEQVTAWGMDELSFTTELIVSELVTNAIRHASGPVCLRVIRDRTLICEVTDASSTAPRLRHARTTDEGGRGLFIVAQLARRWGTRYTRGGKVIWTEQPLPGGPAG